MSPQGASSSDPQGVTATLDEMTDDDLRRVVALATTVEERSPEEHAALVRTARFVDRVMETKGQFSRLEHLASLREQP